jgi:L-rhamnonate dehydratase
MEKFDLEYIEQPLPMDDLFGHAQLRAQATTPIALDESAYTMQDVLNIIRHGAADVLLLDPHQAGGLHRVRKAAAVAEAAGLPVTFHSGAELGVSTAAYLHLAASIPNLMLAVDNQYYNQTDDIIRRQHVYKEGTMETPEGPGLGVVLDPEKLKTYSTETIREAYLDVDQPDWFPTKPQY